MATGGGDTGQFTASVAGSEDLSELKCQPCHEDGRIREAVGICTDCQDYLCRKCYDGHTLPKPTRNHHLLDKQQLLKSNIKLKRKDCCTKTCSRHDDDVIKYYCIEHGQICCSVCLSMSHRTCERVQYIPDAAKDLDNNAEFRQAESCLQAAVTHCEKVTDVKAFTVAAIETSCAAAIESVEKHRRAVNDALDKVHTAIVEEAETMKARIQNKITNNSVKYRVAQQELQEFQTRTEQLQRRQQNCDLYTEVMEMKDRLKFLDGKMMNAARKLSIQATQITFTPNLELLENLKNPAMFGKLTGAESGAIMKAEHVWDTDARTTIDTKTGCITGSTFVPDNKLVIIDNNNCIIKAVDMQQDRVMAESKLSSPPWNACTIKKDQVAVTLPNEKQIALVNVVDDSLIVDRTISVNGQCYGVAYKADKLAVSFVSKPYKVQVLNLQGTVLHDITTDQQGQKLFHKPYYLSFDQKGTKLYVTNYRTNSVVRVKLDGTLVATYTDNELHSPTGAVVDGDGNVYVCSNASNNIHQISPDGRKLRVLLGQDDGIISPWSISYREADDTFWVGMFNDNIIKVYQANRVSR